MSLHSQLIIISHLTLLRGLTVLGKCSFEFWQPQTKVIILGSHMMPTKILSNVCERRQTHD